MAAVVAPAGAASRARETPKAFLSALSRAFRKGDTKFLFARLDPAVLQVYGATACQSALQGRQDPTSRLVVRRVGKSQPFVYTANGQSITVADARAVAVTATDHGVASNATVHIALHKGRYSWFTMCIPVGTNQLEGALRPYLGSYTGTWVDTHFNKNGNVTIVVTDDLNAHTLNLALTFTGPLFGAPAPGTEHLAPIHLDGLTFGQPILGTSTIFGPYTVMYDVTGKVTVAMPQCPRGSCTLTGTLTPTTFNGTVAINLKDGTTSQGTVTLKKG